MHLLNKNLQNAHLLFGAKFKRSLYKKEDYSFLLISI